jgi:hypothetical protein
VYVNACGTSLLTGSLLRTCPSCTSDLLVKWLHCNSNGLGKTHTSPFECESVSKRFATWEVGTTPEPRFAISTRCCTLRRGVGRFAKLAPQCCASCHSIPGGRSLLVSALFTSCLVSRPSAARTSCQLSPAYSLRNGRSPLIVHWPDQKHKYLAFGVPEPPAHMKVQVGPIESALADFEVTLSDEEANEERVRTEISLRATCGEVPASPRTIGPTHRSAHAVHSSFCSSGSHSTSGLVRGQRSTGPSPALRSIADTLLGECHFCSHTLEVGCVCKAFTRSVYCGVCVCVCVCVCRLCRVCVPLAV